MLTFFPGRVWDLTVKTARMTCRAGVPLFTSLGSAAVLVPRVGSFCCISFVLCWGVSYPLVLCEVDYGSLCCTLFPK
jgi:hypothetical protein